MTSLCHLRLRENQNLLATDVASYGKYRWLQRIEVEDFRTHISK